MTTGYRRRISLALPSALLSIFVGVLPGSSTEPLKGSGSEGEPRKIVREGIAVEFSIDPLGDGEEKSGELLEGQDVAVRFKITDTTMGAPLTGLRPSAWMDGRPDQQAGDPGVCREKIQSFLQGSLRARPEIDFNAYYLLALNQEPNISVIDPLLGFGGSKLLALVHLKSPGEDWALSRDQKRLFVAMPRANQVAVVDTTTWKVLTNLEAGVKPTRLALQPDGKYLWVGNDGTGGGAAEGGVTVIDAVELKVAKRIRTGAGQHGIAFTDDDRSAFVTNMQDGSLSIIDVQKLAKVKDVKTGRSPAAVAFSPLSKAVYVITEAEGTILVVDGRKHTLVARMKAKPGLRALRFVPDGRWGFVVNQKENVVYILDASTNRIRHTVDVEKGPDQIAFTKDFAYVRSTSTEQVSMIQLSGLGKGGTLPVSRFPGGQIPPEKASTLALADAIVPTPEGNAVAVANPADKTIYYYTEGMAAPMGSFQNYRREPRAMLVLDRSLRETAPGVYSATGKLTRSGTFELALLLDAPRIVHCFEVSVKPNPALAKTDTQVAVRVEPLLIERKIRIGEGFRLQFRVTDSTTNHPKIGLKDVGVLAVLAPGIWQKRAWAQSVGEGIYEVDFVPPQAGVYYVFFQVPSLKVRLRDLPPLILQATAETQTPATSRDKAAGGLK